MKGIYKMCVNDKDTKAEEYRKNQFEKSFNKCVKDINNNKEFDLNDFEKIIKNTSKDYIKGSGHISFELMIRYYHGDIYFNIDKNLFTVASERYDTKIITEINNEQAHERLYNRLLDFCK